MEHLLKITYSFAKNTLSLKLNVTACNPEHIKAFGSVEGNKEGFGPYILIPVPTGNRFILDPCSIKDTEYYSIDTFLYTISSSLSCWSSSAHPL